MIIAIGSDDAGYSLKEVIKGYLASKDIDIKDFGAVSECDPTLYPETAKNVATAVAEKRYDRGILICGTGIGMCIVANKIGGVRAALCHDTYSAERARKSNDAQIITLGARVIGSELAKKIIDEWLGSDFAGGSSQPKLDMINTIDHETRKN